MYTGGIHERICRLTLCVSLVLGLDPGKVKSDTQIGGGRASSVAIPRQLIRSRRVLSR